jgi:hypothetical protein
MKLIPSLLLLAASTSFCSELTWVDEPEVDDPIQVKPLTAGGIKATAKASKRVFSRDGIRVAELVTNVITIENKKPMTTKSIRFVIDKDNWFSVSLDEPRVHRSRTKIEVAILASPDSITVVAPERKYCETFFQSTRKFMNDKMRDETAPSFFKSLPAL